MLSLIIWIIDLLTLYQIKWPWDERPPEEWYEGPSLILWILGWVFLCIGLTFFAVLVIYTKYGREISIKLSVLTILMGSIFLGFGFHFILLNFGY